MKFHARTSLTSIALGASLMVGAMAPGLVFAGDEVTVYFTRHAEKQKLLTEADDGHLYNPSDVKDAEELNEFGEQRAAALAGWFLDKGITEDLTHIFSSQKLRTRQTIAAIAENAMDMNGDDLLTRFDQDYVPGDGIQQYNTNVVVEDYEGRLETLDSPSDSVDWTVDTLKDLPAGSVALVAMHSGTFYKILSGLGIDTPDVETDEGLFPKDSKFKISTFGDIWKVEMEDGEANVEWRKNLQFEKYKTAVKYED